MLENKIKQIKKFELKKIIFPAILLAYFGLLSLLLFSSAQFFTRELNLALTTDDGLEAAQNQPALDLAGYSLLEKKFKLTPTVSTPAPAVVEPQALASSTASSTPVLDATSTPPQVESTSTEPLTISILNSTKIAGLAGKLKKQLEDAGWPVANVGNHSPVLSTTTINLSPQLADDSGWTTIKSILTENGYLYIENLLPVAGKYDMEIIIGNH